MPLDDLPFFKIISCP